MTSEWFAAGLSFLSLIVTIIGWYKTYSKQVELEKIKGDIQRTLSEHDTRFMYLHQLRGKVIDELYKRIEIVMRLLQASDAYVQFDNENSKAQQREEALRLLSPVRLV